MSGSHEIWTEPAVRLRHHVLVYGLAESFLDVLMQNDGSGWPGWLDLAVASDYKAAAQVLARRPIAAIIFDLTRLGAAQPTIPDDIHQLSQQCPALAIVDATPGPQLLRALEQCQITPLPKSHMTPMIVRTIVDQLTRRREVERVLTRQNEELADLQRHYQAILYGSPHGMCVLRPGWKIEWANHSLAVMFDPSASDAQNLVGQTLPAFFPSPEAFEDFEQSILDELQDMTAAAREVLLQRDNGQCFHAEISLGRLQTGDDDTGFVATIIDASSRHDVGVQLRRQQDFENLIARLSLLLLKSSPEDEAAAMETVLSEVGAYFEVDRCYLLESANDFQSVEMVHIWRRGGVPVFQKNQTRFPIGNLPMAIERLNSGRDLFFQEMDELPPEAEAERRFFQMAGVRSLAAVPLCMGRVFQGILCLDTVFEPRVWSTETMSLLKMVSRIIQGYLDRNRWEMRLRSSEQRISLIYDMTPLPMGISRLKDGIYLTVNQAFLDGLGYQRDQVIGKSALELGLWRSPEDRARMIETMKRDGRVSGEFYLINNGRGEQRALMLFIEPLDLEGEPCLLTIAQDVTSLMEAQAKLQESQTELSTIIHTTPDVTMITDLNGTYQKVFIPDSVSLPIPLADYIGKSHHDILSPEAAAEYDMVMHRAVETNSMQIHFYTFQYEGKVYHYESRVMPLGQDRLLKIVRDITPERQLHKQLLEQERFAAIGQTMATVSHCMKNIFTALNGSMHLLDRAVELDDRERIRRSHSLLQKSITRLYLLFMEMLDFSKRREPNLRPMEIRPLFEEVRKSLVVSQADRIDMEIREDRPMIVANLDHEWMYRVLMNLGQNAIDAMPDGGVLTFSVHVTERGKSLFESAQPDGPRPSPWQLVIEVADTGIGIAPENLSSMFQPLFSTKGSRGTGLGLASVHDMVSRQGGRVEVTSQEGRGSQFRVIFPGPAILSCNPQLPESDPEI